jgi:general stress protein YciG
MANTSKRGFASMDPAKQKEIASKGGRAAHAKGTAHEFTSDEARVAGRKGGETVSRDRQHMSAIGREGGHSRGNRTRESEDIAVPSERYDEQSHPASAFTSQDRSDSGPGFSSDRPRDGFSTTRNRESDRTAGSSTFGSFNGRGEG